MEWKRFFFALRDKPNGSTPYWKRMKRKERERKNSSEGNRGRRKGSLDPGMPPCHGIFCSTVGTLLILPRHPHPCPRYHQYVHVHILVLE